LRYHSWDRRSGSVDDGSDGVDPTGTGTLGTGRTLGPT
jgi:hypothetical protein